MIWTDRLSAARAQLAAHETKVRFVLAGGLNTAFGLLVFPVLLWTVGPLGVHYMIALSISQIVAVTFSYLSNKFLVFRTKANYLAEYRRFVIFHLGYFLVNLAALPFLVEIVHIKPIVAQFIFSVAVIVTSYFWHTRVTFKPKELDP